MLLIFVNLGMDGCIESGIFIELSDVGDGILDGAGAVSCVLVLDGLLLD